MTPVLFRRRVSLWIAPALLCLSAAPADAAVRLPSIFGQDMVLQRDREVPVWGWADPGERVTVDFAGHARSAVAGPDGRWSVRLPPMRAERTGRTLTVNAGNTIRFTGVVVGEVWLCSGQSNMEWTAALSARAQEEIAAGNHPLIRHVKIPHRPASFPEQDVPNDGWKVCTPQSVGNFTAVGYFFARRLVEALDVPVGLIGCNWGGTRIEPWISPDGFRSVPALAEIASKLDTFPARSIQPDRANPLRRVMAINFQTPLALWNGMVHPLVPYAIRGALWYQGESNNGEGLLYLEKMKALIHSWRTAWNDPEMPFYFVQLAPFRYNADPTHLPGIWDAQRLALSISHTGMAVTTDIGDLRDIHPRNKQEVGRRLALWALAKTYGKDVGLYSGPLYDGISLKGSRAVVRFRHTGKALKTRDGRPPGDFEVAGADGRWVAADAAIQGKTVVVSSPQVGAPVAVRFGWRQEAEPNLVNEAGLPASPFQARR